MERKSVGLKMFKTLLERDACVLPWVLEEDMKIVFSVDQHWKAGVAGEYYFFFNNWVSLSLRQ